MRWRFLLFVLIAAAIPPFAAFILTERVAATGEAELDQRLTAAASALQARLDADAARRHDLLLRLSLLPSIVDPLHQAAEAGAAPPPQALSRVEESLATLFPAEAGDVDVAALATAQGAEAFFATGEHSKTMTLKTSDLPPAEAALNGEWVDSYQWFHGALYSFGAAPIGIADAAIVVGSRIGNATTRGWRDRVRGDVSLIADGKVIGSSLKADQRVLVIGATVRPNIMFASGPADTGIPVPALRSYFPLFIRHVGEFRSLAVHLNGAYSVVTIRARLGWIGAVQFAGLAIGLGLLILGFIWAQVVYGPVQRQARSIEAHLARLGAERSARLTRRGFGPPFVAIAELIDQVVEQWNREGTPAAAAPSPKETPPQEAPRPTPRPMVGLPLTASPPRPDAPEGTPAFPFKDDPRVSGARPAIPNGAMPPATPVSGPRPTSAPSAPRPVTSSPPQAPVIAGPRSGSRSGLGPVSQPTPALKSGPGESDASVPPERLARSGELEKELLEAPADPDEGHFRAVFEEFLSARERCGEPTEGLTFDRFEMRLRKNRDQLVEKYACKSVRFQVYEKDGKAAVKALPVR